MVSAVLVPWIDQRSLEGPAALPVLPTWRGSARLATLAASPLRWKLSDGVRAASAGADGWSGRAIDA